MRTLLIGRWQPPHLGHLSVVERACESGEVILAVGSALKANSLKNPFSAGERIEMWKRVLSARGLSVIFVTLPDAPSNDEWVEYVRLLCPSFDRVITGDPLSYDLLSEAGFSVSKPDFFRKKDFNGTRVRDLIIEGDDEWMSLVPDEVIGFVREVNGAERLKGIAGRKD